MNAMSPDKERFRKGLHVKLAELVRLLEDAYAQYQNSSQLKAQQGHLASWFPKRIKQMKEREQDAAQPSSAYSAARLLAQGSTAHLFEGNYDWYKGGDIRRAASDVGVLASAYKALVDKGRIPSHRKSRAEAAMARSNVTTP